MAKRIKKWKGTTRIGDREQWWLQWEFCCESARKNICRASVFLDGADRRCVRRARIRHFPREICTRRTSIQNIQTHIQKARTQRFTTKQIHFHHCLIQLLSCPPDQRDAVATHGCQAPEWNQKQPFYYLMLPLSSDEKTNITAVKNHALPRAVNPCNSLYK